MTTVRSLKRYLCTVGLMLVAIVLPTRAQEERAIDPDALNLLRAVEAARVQTPPVKISYSYWVHGKEVYRNVLIELDAANDRYRITAGAGTRNPLVSIYDGEQLLSFDNAGSAVISRRDQPPPGFSFDPRAIGLIPIYNAKLTLDKQIPYSSAKRIRLSRRESVDDVATVVVHLVDQFGEENRYWIQPTKNYRVVRFEKEIRFVNGDDHHVHRFEVTSRFPAEAPQGMQWIPSEVHAKGIHDGVETLNNELRGGTIEVVKGFPPHIWTLKGLNMPVGQPVVDLRIKERIGYWNSDGVLTEEPMASPARPTSTAAPKRAGNFFVRSLLLIVNAVALIAVVVYFLVTRKKA